jgi:hypothetical protein
MDESGARFKSPGAPPTVRQVYALAGALCEKVDEPFPETREQASELIERLRREAGHPAPRLEDTPVRSRRDRRRGARGADKLASKIAARVAEELR